MSITRSLLLWGSQNNWMRERFPHYRFVRSAVRKFMPGEDLSDAISAAHAFSGRKMGVVLTRLGENISNPSEADAVSSHYLDVLDRVHQEKLSAEISLKLTQLGFDLSTEETIRRFSDIAERAAELGNFVWIDMEDSSYTRKTIDFYRRIRPSYKNIGLCLQAYLYRTAGDIEELLDLRPNLRIVKGAYREDATRAFRKKSEVDANYFQLAQSLFPLIASGEARIIFATHDERLLGRILVAAAESGLAGDKLEFNMLYGIKSSLQVRMVEKGCSVGVLISYGSAWFPWYMRRLAERPANLWFVLKNMFRR
jgi:proline dehydrogenase